MTPTTRFVTDVWGQVEAAERVTLRPDPFTEIREALQRCWDGGQTGGAVRMAAASGLVALERLEREAAERETALVCSWCGDEFESDGTASNCCSCDPVPASALPSLLKDARREAEELNEAGWKEQGAAEARVREVEAEQDRLVEQVREVAAAGCNETERAEAAETTVAQQAGVLRAAKALIDWVDLQGSPPFSTIDHNFRARVDALRAAVLASPEAPAAEPPRSSLTLRQTENYAPFYGFLGSWHRDAALPAVDAPPEPTT